MVVFVRGGVRIAEIWFDDEPDETGLDIIRRFYSLSPPSAGRSDRFMTILLDLRQTEDELLAGMKKDTRYAIRRAEKKDALEWNSPDAADETILAQFCDMYNDFAGRSGRLLLDARAIGRLQLYAVEDLLRLTQVQGPDGSPLTWHAYILGAGQGVKAKADRRARLRHSFSSLSGGEESAFRQLIGRANRYHHWCDMLDFKKDGFAWYDLGGWYAGSEDEKKLKINKFKEEFGGAIVTNYNCMYSVSFKGRPYMSARTLLHKISR